MEYVVRDRDIRATILKRTRKGKRLWLNRALAALAPLWLLPELVYCAGFTLFVVATPRPEIDVFDIRGLLPIMILATMLVLCRLLVHTVRFMHAMTRMSQRLVIVEDLVAGPVLAFGWLVFLGVLWVAPLRGALGQSLVGGGGG